MNINFSFKCEGNPTMRTKCWFIIEMYLWEKKKSKIYANQLFNANKTSKSLTILFGSGCIQCSIGGIYWTEMQEKKVIINKRKKSSSMTFCLRKVTKLKENKGKNISKRNVRTTEKVECLIMNNFSLWKKARKKDVCSGKRKKKVGASNSMRTMSSEIK